MTGVYLRVSNQGMPRETLEKLLNRLHQPNHRQPCVTPEPINGSHYVQFDDKAAKTRDAVKRQLELMRVEYEYVKGLPDGRKMPPKPQKGPRATVYVDPLDVLFGQNGKRS